jgi:phosphate starvation-inducible protein PhoH and related proteins
LVASISIQFENNQLLPSLFGEQDSYLKRIGKGLGIEILMRGNKIILSGAQDAIQKGEKIISNLYKKLEQGSEVTLGDVDAALRLARDKRIDQQDLLEPEIVIKTMNRLVSPYSHRQQNYVKMLYDKEMAFAEGPAGTGKTYLAVAVAVSMFLNHRVEKIILSRPAVEAGEKIGFLPGDMKDKVDPYMQPLYDALYDMIPAEKVQKNLQNGIFEIAPLAFMRGRTLKNAFIILDEAQNATSIQMKMFLTRLGEGSRMVINGDLSQIDLPRNVTSGLSEAIDKLKAISDIGFITFDAKDVVRHNLVAKIVTAYQTTVQDM